jgi:hypothetical protein
MEMTKHIQDAIQLNLQRMPLYSKLTDGASVQYSKFLIRQERLTLLLAQYFDRMGSKFQRKGIPIVYEEFVDMNQTPDFSPSYPTEFESLPDLQKINSTLFRKALRKTVNGFDFEKVKILCEEELESISKQPHVYCMYRHVLESMRRIAHFAPIHAENTANRGIRTTAFLSHKLLQCHLPALKKGMRLDESVAFIQTNGVPFLYQDLPTIGLKPKGSYSVVNANEGLNY